MNPNTSKNLLSVYSVLRKSRSQWHIYGSWCAVNAYYDKIYPLLNARSSSVPQPPDTEYCETQETV